MRFQLFYSYLTNIYIQYFLSNERNFVPYPCHTTRSGFFFEFFSGNVYLKHHKRYRKRLWLWKKVKFFLSSGWINIFSQLESNEELMLGELFKTCRSLEKVFIGHLSLKDNQLEPLLECKMIKQLDISWSCVSQELVTRMFTAWPELQLLDLSFCRGIEEFNVEEWEQLYPRVSIQLNYTPMKFNLWWLYLLSFLIVKNDYITKKLQVYLTQYVCHRV